MSSRAKLSLPPDRQTMTLSPAPIMLKSAIAWPTWRRRRLASLLFSKDALRASLNVLDGLLPPPFPAKAVGKLGFGSNCLEAVRS
jgi:hypothetical protein